MKVGCVMSCYLSISKTVGCVLLTAFIWDSKPATAAKSLSDLTGPWQLFVDDYLISIKYKVARKYHPFEKYAGNPIVMPDKPWEKNTAKCCMVLPNEERTGFRMWYSCWAPKNDPDRGHALYAISKDGITWEKPNLGLIPWKVNGSTENNIISVTGCVAHTPWNDLESQYTTIAFGSYKVMSSPDGFKRERITKESVITGGGDVGRFHWDPHTNSYRGYVKVARKVRGLRRRSVGFSKSTTPFEPWPKLRLVLAPDDYDDRWVKEEGSIHRTHFYGLTPFSYETMYFGFLWIFRAHDDEGYFFGPIFTELVTSRDGIHWRRQDPPRTPMIDIGAPGAWDDGMVASAALVVDGDRFLAYYTGYDDTHDILPMHSSIGLATLRKDGFASIDAGASEGKLTTKRLTGTNGPLHVNYNAKNGWLRVEFLDEDGQVIPGYGEEDCNFLRGESVDKKVIWSEKTELPADHASLRLRFIMQNASLYSFMAGDKLQVIEDPPQPILAALYTFEQADVEDKKIITTDHLSEDGIQSLTFYGTTSRGTKLNSEPENTAFGQNSVYFYAAFTPRCTIEIDGTSELGKQFTLAVMAKSADNRHARLFSSYDDLGACKTSELVFDCDPTGTAVAGLRLIGQGISVESKPLNFADGKYHHLAVVYDDGEVTFYLDGNAVGRDWVGGGAPVSMERNLFVGEDAKHGNEQQFRGYMDDILVLGRALTADEIKVLSQKGAEAFFAGN
ncbi:MAG: hypothetical protein JSV03_03510 [Planctomycetota bacterium]|nr:MAG: hypothetical protein JSV03_03510 [Planctomycetota bacterium]